MLGLEGCSRTVRNGVGTATANIQMDFMLRIWSLPHTSHGGDSWKNEKPAEVFLETQKSAFGLKSEAKRAD